MNHETLFKIINTFIKSKSKLLNLNVNSSSDTFQIIKYLEKNNFRIKNDKNNHKDKLIFVTKSKVNHTVCSKSGKNSKSGMNSKSGKTSKSSKCSKSSKSSKSKNQQIIILTKKEKSFVSPLQITSKKSIARKDAEDDIKKDFFKADTDHSGSIELGELQTFLKKQGHNIKKKTLKNLFSLYDDNPDNKLEMKEYIQFKRDLDHGHLRGKIKTIDKKTKK